MKVLSVIGSLAVRNGGPGVNLVRSAPELRALGVDLKIVTTDMATPSAFKEFRRMDASDLPPGSELADITVTRAQTPHQINFAPRIHRAIARAIADRDIVRIHGMYLYPHFAAFAAARKRQIPYVVSPHGILDPYIRTRSRTVKRAFDATWQGSLIRHADFVHATTDDEAGHILEVFPSANVVVVPNGLDLTRFAHASGGDAFRTQQLEGWSGPVITCLGRISHKKGLDILIEAAGRVARERDLRLVIVGPDDERLQPSLERLAHDVGLSGRVTFTGPLYGADQVAALAATSVWALPSRGENFGNAVAEAMAAGLPVVISPEVGLAPDITRHNAGVVSPGDAAAFAESIARLLGDPTAARNLGQAGAAYVQRFSWPIVAGQLRDLYAETLARRV